jgi:hypothetical protein
MSNFWTVRCICHVVFQELMAPKHRLWLVDAVFLVEMNAKIFIGRAGAGSSVAVLSSPVIVIGVTAE